jgi:hypothetical protein
MAKLTLSIEDEVIQRAKTFAEQRGTSVSALVERYLDLITRGSTLAREGAPPILARLRGTLAGADVEDHRRHLERKYR